MPYVGASDFPDDRLFADDADDNTEPADGCTRKPARTIAKKSMCRCMRISMMMSIALRFIPILLEETDKIMKAQMARGADFESGNIIQRVKNMVPLLVPLFISAFRRANDLALAMEARCYHGGEGRTQMKPLRYQTRDYAAYGVLMAYLVCSIGLRVCGL